MHCPIFIHKDRDCDYGVIVPDLPGCFSAGATVDEAIAHAAGAIALHLEGLRADGRPVPSPSSIEGRHDDPDYADGVWSFVAVSDRPVAA